MNTDLLYPSVRYFAQGYGCGDYGETENYNTCETSDATDPQTSTGSLSDTGILVAVFVVTAVVVLVASLAVRFWKGKSSKKDVSGTDQ